MRPLQTTREYKLQVSNCFLISSNNLGFYKSNMYCRKLYITFHLTAALPSNFWLDNVSNSWHDRQSSTKHKGDDAILRSKLKPRRHPSRPVENWRRGEIAMGEIIIMQMTNACFVSETKRKFAQISYDWWSSLSTQPNADYDVSGGNLRLFHKCMRLHRHLGGTGDNSKMSGRRETWIPKLQFTRKHTSQSNTFTTLYVRRVPISFRLNASHIRRPRETYTGAPESMRWRKNSPAFDETKERKREREQHAHNGPVTSVRNMSNHLRICQVEHRWSVRSDEHQHLKLTPAIPLCHSVHFIPTTNENH